MKTRMFDWIATPWGIGFGRTWAPHPGRWVSALAVASILAASGCGGDSGTAATPADYSGSWSGTTGARKAISFAVSDGQVTSASVGLAVCMGGKCCTFTFASSEPGAISGSSFSIPVKTTSGVSYKTTINGTFTSATAANGTIGSFQASGLICGGSFVMGTPASQGGETWTASK